MIRHAAALLLGLAAVVLANRAGPPLLEKFGFVVPGRKPVMTNGDLVAFLTFSFLAGFLGAFVIGAVSRPLHPAPILIYLGIGLALDGLAILNTLAGFPAWFKVTFVGTLPLQAWLGVIAGTAVPVQGQWHLLKL